MKSFFALILLLPLTLSAEEVISCDAYPEPFKWGVNSSASEYAKKGKFSLNDQGVLVHDYGSSYENLGKWENPFFISRYANALYRDWYIRGCKEKGLIDKFMLQASFLRKTADINNNIAVWRYSFDNDYYNVNKGWISGIGQSHIAGILYRAAIVSKDSSYTDISQMAMNVYKLPMSDGGVVTKEENSIWIQEVPTSDGRSFRILNGHITGLFGVIDYSDISGDRSFSQLISGAKKAVFNNLGKFDAGFSSFYSLQEKDKSDVRVAPINGYHALHVWQLNRLADYFGDNYFREYATRFAKYIELNSTWTRNASNSTNPASHGPDEAAGYYANRYWSSNKFPSSYDLGLAEGEILNGFVVLSHTQSSSPSDFAVMINDGSEYYEVTKVFDSDKKNIFIKFDRPHYTKNIRLIIDSDNGNGNVALDGVMPVICQQSRKKDCEINFDDKVSVTVRSIFPGYLQY